MADVSEGAVALAKAKLQQGQPPKDRVFYARHHTAIKWTPYRPNSQEVKRGKKGRWQELRPFGIGWQNTEVVPEAGAWVEDIINRPELATRAAPPAMDREAVERMVGDLERMAGALEDVQERCRRASADFNAAQSVPSVKQMIALSGISNIATHHLAGINLVRANALSTLSADAIRQGEETFRPYSEWSEDDRDVLWWMLPVQSTPYLGSPLDLGFTVGAQLYNQFGDVIGKSEANVGGWPFSASDEANLVWSRIPATPASHASDGGK